MCGRCRCAPTTGSTRSRWSLLCITGYLIGHPIAHFYAPEAYQQYWFGWVRFIHFAAAYVYVFNFAARIYWGFVGNKYARWNNFFPLKRSQRQEIVDVIKTDVLADQDARRNLHRAQLAGGFIYFFTFLAFCLPDHHRLRALLQHEQFVAAADVHVDCAADGRRFGVRFWHHLFLWFFVTFIIVHIYLAFYHDYIEGRGTISSIVGGWKFDREKSK